MYYINLHSYDKSWEQKISLVPKRIYFSRLKISLQHLFLDHLFRQQILGSKTPLKKFEICHYKKIIHPKCWIPMGHNDEVKFDSLLDWIKGLSFQNTLCIVFLGHIQIVPPDQILLSQLLLNKSQSSNLCFLCIHDYWVPKILINDAHIIHWHKNLRQAQENDYPNGNLAYGT